MTYSRISGTGRYLPEKILTNADLEKMVDTTDEWIRTRTGIRRRHVAAENEKTSDLAIAAAMNALAAAGLTGADIDAIRKMPEADTRNWFGDGIQNSVIRPSSLRE